MSEEQKSLEANEVREYGTQPLDALMTENGLENHTIVVASGSDHLTHKMVAKARNGRFLSMRVRLKVLKAVNAATKTEHTLKDLFTY